MDTSIPPTIPAALDRAVSLFGDGEGLVTGGKRLTFRQLGEEVDDAARALIGSGVGHGDRVAIWAPNIAGWPIIALAAYRVGAVVVPLNTRFKGAEAVYVLESSGASMLFTVTDFLGVDYVSTYLDAGPVASVVEVVAMDGGTPRPGSTTWTDFVGRSSTIEPAEVAARSAAVGADDLSDIMFTSGTTGRPKGAMIRHGASVRAFSAWTELIGLEAADRYLIVNPFFHAFGLKAGILACVLTGATMIPQMTFDVPAVLACIAAERISMLPGPPTIYQTMLDHPDLHHFDTSSLRLAVTGAAAVPVEMIRRMREEMTFRTIVTGYGLTETTGVVSMCRFDDDPQTISETSGRALPGVEVRLVDEDGHDVAEGQPGEVIVRGYNLMAGYYRDPEATAEAIDTDGWLHTGDIATMDDAGNLRITDRIKDMFIVGGFNAYPAEIEGTLARHRSVGRAAVVGIPDQRMGEVGVAFVIPRSGASIDPEELIAWSRQEMANYKVPRRIVVVDDFPVNASNKVLKFELRQRAMAIASEETPTIH